MPVVENTVVITNKIGLHARHADPENAGGYLRGEEQ